MNAVLISSLIVPGQDRTWRAAAAYLAQYKGLTRQHAESDLRSYLMWCAEHQLDPVEAKRVHIELFVRWMQEERRYKPATVSGSAAGTGDRLGHAA